MKQLAHFRYQRYKLGVVMKQEKDRRGRVTGFIVALAIVLASFESASAQPGGEIRGQITDPTGAALSGALVSLKNVATELEQEVVSDSTGRFVFNPVSIGIYRVKVQRAGFSDATRTITLAEPGEVLEVNFEISPGSIAETVTVTASRGERDVLEVPVRASVQLEEIIHRENPATTGDVLLSLPSLTPVNSGPYLVRPRLRGLDSTRLVLMVDGERLNTSRVATDRAGPELGLIDPSQVQSIEVVHGAGSALYGTDALSGTINVITDMPEPTDRRFRVGGSFNGFFSSNEIARRGTGKLDIAGRKFAVRTSLMLERFPNYNAGRPFHESSEPVVQPVTVFSDTPTTNPAILVPPPGRTIQQILLGIAPDPFNTPFTRTTSEISNSQSHGSNLSITARLFPVTGQSIRLRLTQRRTSFIGFPDFKQPFFFQVINLPFSDLDKASLRYEASGLSSWLTRISGGGYWQDQDRLLRNDFTVLGVSPVADIPNRDNLTRVSVLSNTRQNVKSFGFDANVGLLIAGRNVITLGMDFFRDHSRDTRTTRTRVEIIGQGDRVTRRARFFSTPSVIVPSAISQPQRVPIANFRDAAFFVEDELEVSRWLRLLGSFRVDRIKVETLPTVGYVPRIPSADPPFDPKTFPAAEGDTLNRTAFTGNFGFVLRPRDVLSVTARIGRSFRHPNLEELLFYGPATIGAIVPNLTVKPEQGINLDIGAKLRTAKVAGEFTYFNNTFTNFISTEIVTVAKDDAEFANGSPISQAGNFLSRLRIQGIEANLELPISYRTTVFTWFGNLHYLHGEILRGKTALRTTLGIREVDIDGAPADNISPFKSVLGMRWNDGSFRYWWEYNVRIQTRVNRVSPFILESPFLIAQDLFGLYGFSVHTARAGYNFNRERYTLSLSVALENLGNKFYREHFQFAPARGRSLTIGVNYRFF